MILRRLTDAIREQNWAAVIIEFVIVLSGVVIGFQFTAWNEARQDADREALIISRLLADFTVIEEDVTGVITDLERRAQAASGFIEMIRDEMSRWPATPFARAWAIPSALRCRRDDRPPMTTCCKVATCS